MSPVTHALASGVLSGISGLQPRERIAIVLAGIAPDLDGLGAIPEFLTRRSAHPVLWFSIYHHKLHSLLFAVLCSAIAFILCRPRLLTALWVILSLHLHLLCDLAGARGPDGDTWPIPYFSPFSERTWQWAGQWPLNGWQNFVITGLLLFATGWLAVRNGYSIVEVVSTRADAHVVGALRGRFSHMK